MIRAHTRLLLILLALLAVGAARLFGECVHEWRKGGENGVVNLPLAACQVGTSVVGGSQYRVGYQMDHIENGVTLVLPSNMNTAMATFSTSGVGVAVNCVDGSLRLEGADLVQLRDGDVPSFEVRLVDSGSKMLEIAVLLTPGEPTFQVCVR